METGVITRNLRIGGMTCVNCQNKLEKKLRDTTGVRQAAASYNAGTVSVTYDTDVVSLREITAVIERLSYKVQDGNEKQALDIERAVGLLLIIFSLYAILEHLGLLNFLSAGQLATTNMGYGMMFVIGLTTSLHCIAMCGGINISQCVPRGGDADISRFSVIRPAFLYNFGRVFSYTAVGFAVGALGSAITFTNAMQGVLKLIAGAFMIVMGINMLGLFPWLRRLNPRMPKIFAKKIDNEKGKRKSPLVIGLLTGFMPCGPLQAMQIYALSTGSPFTGALSMFLFSMGTVPLMFGLGAFTGIIGRKFTSKVMTAGAILVAVLGISMLTQGWNLAGFSEAAPPAQIEASSETTTLLTVQGMTCNSCVANIRRAVSALGGVTNVRVTLSTGRVAVEHEPGVSENTIRETITALGYRIVQ